MNIQTPEEWSELEVAGVAESVARRILELIKDGRLKPGDKLPTENELIKMLGVGRSSIREAKRMLGAMKLVESKPGVGSFVRQIDASSVISSDVAHLLLADEAASALQEARELLEPAAAALAAERAKAEDLLRIRGALQEMEKRVNEAQSPYDAGMAFHLAIMRASDNPVLVNLYRPIMDLLTKHQRPLYERRADREEELRQHLQIYRSIEESDPVRARVTMCEHLRYVRKVTAAILRDAGPDIAERKANIASGTTCGSEKTIKGGSLAGA